MQVKSNSGKTLKDMSVSIPTKKVYTSKFLTPEFQMNNNYSQMREPNGFIQEMLVQQHPLINAWLVLSSVSICFLTALLFIIH